jgi:hypothetical protein
MKVIGSHHRRHVPYRTTCLIRSHYVSVCRYSRPAADKLDNTKCSSICCNVPCPYWYRFQFESVDQFQCDAKFKFGRAVRSYGQFVWDIRYHTFRQRTKRTPSVEWGNVQLDHDSRTTCDDGESVPELAFSDVRIRQYSSILSDRALSLITVSKYYR